MSVWEALGKAFGALEKNAGKVAIGLGGATVGAVAGASAASPGVEINNPQNAKIDEKNSNYLLGAIFIIILIIAIAGIYYLKNK